MAAPHVVTLGCRLNAFESEAMRAAASTAGLDDTVIVNTCAVTTEAVRQARQTIRRMRRERPAARLVVTGCAAQLDPAAFAAMPEVDRVIGNAEKLSPGHLAGAEPVVVSDIMMAREVASPFLAGFEHRTRAFLQVQQGCNHRCTFCIIPFARGANRSVAPERVIGQARDLVDAGHAEVVLTGVDLCSWGDDLPGRPRLGALVRRLLSAVPQLPRLRLSSLDPAAVDDDLFHALGEEPRLMPHLHLSLQAADDMVLKRMKRRHTRTDAVRLVARARQARPDVVFGADLIAGFPTETETMFERTHAAVDELGLTYLHVFPYSPRPSTPAARMPQVPAALRRERAAALRAAGQAAARQFLAGRIGTVTDVLVEDGQGGRCPQYAPVRLDEPAPAGAIVRAAVTGAADDHLLGRVVP